VQLEPEVNHKVFLPVPGILEEIKVTDGQAVHKGDELARFSSRDVDTDLLEAETQYAVHEEQLRAIPVEMRDLRGWSPSDIAGKLIEKARLEGEKNGWGAKLVEQRRKKEALTLRAPRDGVVMSCPRPDELGKYWDKDQDRPFCTVGDPSQLQALVPVEPAEMSLLSEDLRALHEHGKDLDVTIRVQGWHGHTWAGRVESLPEEAAKEVPVQLTSKAGGPLAEKPGQRPGMHVPQGQVYLIRVQLLDPDKAIYPGTMAEVKIHCRWRTAAWWVWRWISTKFDVRLM